MANEEIITALRNAVNNGEQLESAVQIMINSGYDQAEVYEASKFVGGGVTPNLQPRTGETLVMPQNKGFLVRQPSVYQNQQPGQIPQPQQRQPEMQVGQQQMQEGQQYSQQQGQSPPQHQPSKQPMQQGQQYNQQQGQIPPQQFQNQTQPQYQSFQNIQTQPIKPGQPTYSGAQKTPGVLKEPEKIKPKKNYTKEIILVAILVFLIGVLIVTILFKDSILKFFSG